MSTDPTRPMPRQYGQTARYPVPPRYRRRRHPARGWIIALFSVLVLLIVAVIADRVFNGIAENDAASQIQRDGFPARPAVDIKGFPFLTQVLARNIGEADISASNVPEGPIELGRVTATATGIHLDSSYRGGVIDHVSGSALITFASLAGATGGGSGAGLTISAAGPDKVNISAGPVSEQADVRVHGNTITFHAVDNGDLISGLFSSLGSFSVTVPRLPEGMRITGGAITQEGLRISAAAQHVRFTQ